MITIFKGMELTDARRKDAVKITRKGHSSLGVVLILLRGGGAGQDENYTQC